MGMKKAPHGKSFNTDKGKKNPDAAGKLGGLHKAGKTVPLFNANRIDKMENTNPKGGTGGVKS